MQLKEKVDLPAFYQANGTQVICEFTSGPEEARRWFSLNDVVMGGKSTGTLQFDSSCNAAVFSGTLSSEGSGGFASVRSGDLEMDLSRFGGFELDIEEGDGRIYKLCAIGPAKELGVVYQADFRAPGTGEKRKIVQIPFSTFKASVMGRSVPDIGTLKGADVSQLGLMVSKVSENGGDTPGFLYGPFELRVKSIKATA
eukprot:CAMPEP_0184481578 /NCGR_PEP_ID=MMETSP0113_2-20130426/3130_1 /TAXON_ID=91329 /ORGANISM="Norrisiella sphaerica, Strain BC52" /LENGTH=197 /DNA_ID=CAMNT_0026860783 /DNA_START=375 /DNA_END=968 /DNA_ORIENTATION=-